MVQIHDPSAAFNLTLNMPEGMPPRNDRPHGHFVFPSKTLSSYLGLGFPKSEKSQNLGKITAFAPVFTGSPGLPEGRQDRSILLIVSNWMPVFRPDDLVTKGKCQIGYAGLRQGPGDCFRCIANPDPKKDERQPPLFRHDLAAICGGCCPFGANPAKTRRSAQQLAQSTARPSESF